VEQAAVNKQASAGGRAGGRQEGNVPTDAAAEVYYSAASSLLSGVS